MILSVKKSLVALGAIALFGGSLGLSENKAHATRPDDILIVVNHSVAIDQMSIAELKQIFLKKKTRWPDGSKAVPLHAPSDSELRQTFNRLVLDMSVSEEQNYWEKLKITKSVIAPPMFGNPLKAVYKIKGSVSYLYRSKHLKGVSKVIMAIPAPKGRDS